MPVGVWALFAVSSFVVANGMTLAYGHPASLSLAKSQILYKVPRNALNEAATAALFVRLRMCCFLWIYTLLCKTIVFTQPYCTLQST